MSTPLKKCQCGSSRFVSAFSAARDCNYVDIPHLHYASEGYMPRVGLGNDGDGTQITVCLDCGRVQGRFPVKDAHLAALEDPHTFEKGESIAKAWASFYTAAGKIIFLRIKRAESFETCRAHAAEFILNARDQIWDDEVKSSVKTAVIYLHRIGCEPQWIQVGLHDEDDKENGICWWKPVPEELLAAETGMPPVEDLREVCGL